MRRVDDVEVRSTPDTQQTRRRREERLVADDEIAIVEPREPEGERVDVHDDGRDRHEPTRVVATRPRGPPDQLQTALFALHLPPLLQCAPCVYDSPQVKQAKSLVPPTEMHACVLPRQSALVVQPQ